MACQSVSATTPTKSSLTTTRSTPGSRLALGLTILARLEGSHRANRGVRERALQRGLPSDAGHFQETLGALRKAGYIRRRGGGWVLSRDLAQVPLDRLLKDLRLTWEPGSAWPEEIERAVTRLFPQRDQALGLSVKDILQNTED